MNLQRILIVEDDPAIADFVQTALKRENFETELVRRGDMVLARVEASPPDLILLDLLLPGMDGLEVCKALRVQRQYIPIIMLTAKDDEVDKIVGFEIGADDYITKPFSMRELVSRIRAQLRRAYGDYSSAESAVVVIQDLVLEQATGQVRRGDEVIALTPIEFRLLMYLARHRGQALSRAQIVEAVWGFAPDVESEKTVNVHVRRLREKIELKPEEPALILTVPGIGYRLAK